MKRTVKKLYRGHVSVRDYIVKECMEKQENLIISYKGQTMTILFDKLQTGKKLTQSSFNSQFNTQNYELIDFPFKADKVVKNEIQSLSQKRSNKNHQCR